MFAQFNRKKAEIQFSKQTQLFWGKKFVDSLINLCSDSKNVLGVYKRMPYYLNILVCLFNKHYKV